MLRLVDLITKISIREILNRRMLTVVYYFHVKAEYGSYLEVRLNMDVAF